MSAPSLPSLSAILALAAVLGLGPVLAVAQGSPRKEAPIGDFAARVAHIEELLGTELTDAEARALFSDLRQLLLERVGDDVVSESDLYLGAIHGMLEAVNRRHEASVSTIERGLPDPTMVISEQQAHQLRRDLDGQMTGIGIDFRLYPEHGVLFVMEVLPGSPGDRAGILPGDRILAVDGIGFGGARVDDVLSLLQGSEGTSLTLRVWRGEGAEQSMSAISLKRGVFPVRSVQDEIGPDAVGWMQVSQLHARTADEVEESVLRLRKLGADRFVLDLRHCQGGDVLAAAAVADLFLAEQAVIVRLVQPGVSARDLVATRDQVVAEELVVLVNRWTQGSAEALASALQEHARAYVIGERTMGSARVETLIPVGHGLVLRVESVRLESPRGTSWQGVGIQPDQPVEVEASVAIQNPAGDPPTGMDQQFQTAVHYLQTERE
jgi:carboxyl-terminal processing protease